MQGMPKVLKKLTICAAFALLAGCSTGPQPVLPAGEAAYEVVPVGDVVSARRQLIGPNDELNISVFREEDLSVKEALVDSDGNVQVPLLGSVPAAGLTANEFGRDLERRLGMRYLVAPSVTVTITEAALRQVTVTGAVTQPGVYEVPSRISLVDAIALARGPSEVAKYRQVVVFRRLSGQRIGALFDLGRINAGLDPDVEIVPGDQVIVGSDSMKQLYRDILVASPLISSFQYIAR